FENIFSEWSFGFRTKKSCHDAIKRVKQRFKGLDYIVKIDLNETFTICRWTSTCHSIIIMKYKDK
ncbi:MAG: hypothetical protein Q8807_04050, partial ['Waltheria sp.' little leaf phytoplasma]|nr:hypothetical protein ['Waltheria sp.' little leaf phytoplasma]